MDEPVLMRYPEVALEIGFPCLELVLANLPPGVTTTLHLCCGYPDRLEPTDYKKADKRRFFFTLQLQYKALQILDLY